VLQHNFAASEYLPDEPSISKLGYLKYFEENMNSPLRLQPYACGWNWVRREVVSTLMDHMPGAGIPVGCLLRGTTLWRTEIYDSQ
jgi:hypothetical protein